eukprot:scaffold96176_cov61-Cyclotella_meneghiniana.AAC.1
MAMVEVPGGSAVGGRSNHESRPPHDTLFSRGPPRKSRGASGIGKQQVPTGGEAPSLVTLPLISCSKVLQSVPAM